jgi:hypothetical protein
LLPKFLYTEYYFLKPSTKKIFFVVLKRYRFARNLKKLLDALKKMLSAYEEYKVHLHVENTVA